jgi:hypothetical protein
MSVKLCLTLREEHKLRVSENRFLRRMFSLTWKDLTEGWTKLCNKALHHLYSPRRNAEGKHQFMGSEFLFSLWYELTWNNLIGIFVKLTLMEVQICWSISVMSCKYVFMNLVARTYGCPRHSASTFHLWVSTITVYSFCPLKSIQSTAKRQYYYSLQFVSTEDYSVHCKEAVGEEHSSAFVLNSWLSSQLWYSIIW